MKPFVDVRASGSAAIELREVVKRFGQVAAVDQLCLRIPAGSTCGLLGPNGAGKSTTIKMLLGIVPPTAGEIRVLGLDVRRQASLVKQRVGYVPESQQIYRWMRVAEVIGFCKTLYPTWNDAVCQETLRQFRLDPDRKVGQLSQGMVAKLALLLAISHDPELLILDEPASSLDPLAREEFLEGVLERKASQGQTVLFSSHLLDDIQQVADTVAILHEGHLLAYGRIEELLATTKRLRATVRNGSRPGQPPAGTIYERLRGAEWLLTVRDFSPEHVRQVSGMAGVEQVDVMDLGLDDLFKDFVRGQQVVE